MLLRSLFTLSLVASGFLASPAAAGDRLMIAGSDGFVMEADTDVGTFEYFACACSGPIYALAADRQRLYTLDEFGQLLVFDVDDGTLLNFLSPGLGQMNALAAARGDVFVGTEDGLVARIDPLTGDVVSSRTAPSGVRALLAHGGFLFAAGADGAVYRAPVGAGEFQYFTCFCFFEIQDMVMIDGDLFIVDSFGLLGRADGETGELVDGFSVGATNSMAATGRTLLFYYEGSGGISEVDSQTGQFLTGGFTTPIDVQVMLVIPEGSPKGTVQLAGKPRSL